MGYEPSDVDLRPVVLFGAILLLAAVIIHVATGGLYAAYGRREEQRKGEPEPAARPPSPALQLSPPQDMRRMREEEEAFLRDYGWIDRTSGKVRIPVERAIDVLLERGFPVREEK